MKLRELHRFRRTSWGEVPTDVIRQLAIPAPDDVLEQFLIDHGLKDHIQRQFGDLDIHRVRWQQRAIFVDDLRAANIDSACRGRVEDCEEEAKAGGFDAIHERYHAHPDVLPSWKERGTWSRSPLALGEAPLRWIEGHSRLGYLRGLVSAGLLSSASRHMVWVGTDDPSASSDESWLDVLKREHISFGDWLVCAQRDGTARGDFGSAIVEAEAERRYDGRTFSKDLAGVASVVGSSPALLHEYALWQAFVRGA